MASQCSVNTEHERPEGQQRDVVLKRSGFLASVFCRISQFWPVSFVVRGFRGLWWLFGFSSPRRCLLSSEAGGSPAVRQCRTGRKRLRWASRLLLSILPRRVQGVLGFPVCTSIGCSVSPDVRCSPTKPCGKGSKRKQDDIDEDEELEQQSWVEALTQELTDEDHAGDPDYEPSAAETDSEEYKSHNETESDLEMEQGVVVIKDLETGIPPEAQ
ncbi:oogenesis-related [Hoplias malabaricus]|uniref:oogenesis-related n=1 Tax=Hoplias malabaricus TaxID=27720 RepID=UPI0034636D18